DADARQVRRRRRRLGRRTLDDRGRDRGGRALRRAHGRAVHALPLAPDAHVRGEDALGDAREVRRPRGARDQDLKEASMDATDTTDVTQAETSPEEALVNPFAAPVGPAIIVI